MWAIRFNDGTEISGLEAWGAGFRRREEIPNSEFTPSRMRDIEIIGDGESADPYCRLKELAGKHEVLRYAGVSYDPVTEYWSVYLEEIPAQDIESAKVRADIEYIAMMMGVEL